MERKQEILDSVKDSMIDSLTNVLAESDCLYDRKGSLMSIPKQDRNRYLMRSREGIEAIFDFLSKNVKIEGLQKK
jgi:hypothetical protein